MHIHPENGEQRVLAKDLAARITAKTDRRSFMRKTAATTFKAVAVLAAGGGLSQAFTKPAWAHCLNACDHRGAGCPVIRGLNNGCFTCGPSRCCSSKAGNCNCASGTDCRSITGYCYGKDLRHYTSTGCWSCSLTTAVSGGCFRRQTVTCCDCKTNWRNCGDPRIDSTIAGRCIGARVTTGPIVC